MTRETNDRKHPSLEVLAAFVDGRLAAPERDEVETHLAGCAECRPEVVAVAKLAGKSRKTRWVWYGAPVAAAAVLALLVVNPFRSSNDGPILRQEQGATALETALPRDGAQVHPDSIVFHWRSAGESAHYQITLMDADGDVTWTSPVSDTSIALPSEQRLGSGQVYFWYVDALLPDGRSIATEVQELTVAR